MYDDAHEDGKDAVDLRAFDQSVRGTENLLNKRTNSLTSGFSLNKELCVVEIEIDLKFKNNLHIKYSQSILGVWGHVGYCMARAVNKSELSTARVLLSFCDCQKTAALTGYLDEGF